MKHFSKLCAVACVVLLAAATFAAPAAPPAPSPAPDAPATPEAAATPIMPLDEVRIGMKGYGMTVFHGTEVEPFPVEVISIIRNSPMGQLGQPGGPAQSIIWIRCPDDRLQQSGPVQGMSGSPIYLWDPDEPRVLGRGGRLIGAFAFGFGLAKDCLVGVQPIEYMRAVGGRVPGLKDEVIVADGGAAGGTTGGLAMAGRQTLAQLEQMATARGLTAGLSPGSSWRLAAVQRLFDGTMGRTGEARQSAQGLTAAALPPGPGGPGADGQVVPMMLPMAVGSAPLAELFGPMLAPMGIQALAAGGELVSGPPPVSIDPDEARLQPGGVLAIPLAFGDLDISAAGTVTDVLPDGTVLGFGHPMFGQGQIALPMATGFVHFVVPKLDTSFKLAGSLAIQGSILRDEGAAVAGNASQRYTSAPVRVSVEMPGQTPQEFNYHVVHHRQLTPVLATIVTLRSVTAIQGLPVENTLYLNGEMRFSNGHRVQLDSMVPGGGINGAVFELLPPLITAMQNPHQMLQLESMDMSIRVVPELRMGTILSARLDQTEVAPGGRVGVTVWVQPYGQPVRQHRLTLDLPAGLEEGDYNLMVADAGTYMNQLASNRPHLFATRSVGDLMKMVQRVMSVQQDAIYLTLQLPEQGIAVGRQELPRLPSSRRALIVTPASTVATPFMDTIEQVLDTDIAIQGQLAFTLNVRKMAGE